MSRRRRTVLLAGLALVLGALAASDVAGREAALRRGLGAPVPVVVAARDLRAGDVLDGHDLRVRQVPQRYAPADGFASVVAASGRRAAVAVPEGTDVTEPLALDPTQAGGAPVAPGQRVADIVAQGSSSMVLPGGHVDVLVTRETGDGQGSTTLALQDAEVLSVREVPATGDDPTSRVSVSLRVTLKQAVYLAAAQSFAKELRVLPRAAGDRRHGDGLTVDATLR